jgi:glycine cleavage system aminomethyltransferase T
MKLPQPHESVQGIDRTRDDLLSLEGPALRRRVVMMDLAHALWKAALNGAHTESGRALYERMTNPRMGDLVVETTGMRHPGRADRDGSKSALHSFGIMLGERTEWACTDERWREYVEEAHEQGEELPDSSRVSTEAVYVQYGPKADDICRWVNASIIALPTGALYHTAEYQD